MSRKIIPQQLINTFWHKPLSFLARLAYGFPDRKLTIIGVTGTDGKTTVANLIYHVLKNANLKVSLITTIEARIGDEVIDTGLHTTTPDKFLTFKLLKKIVDNKSDYLVAEITAHGIDQYRFGNIKYNIGILTNISHEHQDDFDNIKKYTLTKLRLLQRSKIAISNKDDQSYQYMDRIKTKKIFFSQKNKSSYQAKKVKITPNTLSFLCRGIKFITDSNYTYQVENILAAFIACQKIGVKKDIFLNTIKTFPQTKGRRQLVNNRFGFKTIVDFAHTPRALKETLKSLKSHQPNRIIVIFGATGGRDKTKRPLMGQVVSKYSHIAIITSDDTRNELVEDINKDIIQGILPKSQFLKPNQTKSIDPNIFTYFNIGNRQDAFNLAIKIAQKNDIVIACGKGHETTILHGKTEYPWSDLEAYRTAFKLRQS